VDQLAESQIDLADMTDLDKLFRYIVHVRCHFSKLSFLVAIKNKTAEEVAVAFGQFIGLCGPPRLLQHDQGSEFKCDWLFNWVS
jgi:hypothetical protein